MERLKGLKVRKMRIEEAEKRLETIVNASGNDVYDYEIIVSEWNNYGKSRTYFKIIETRNNSKHHVERLYGYIDNESGEYVAGKNDLTENFTFNGARFEEPETEKPKQFKDKEEMDKWFKTKEMEATVNSKNEEEFLKTMMGCAISTGEYIKMMTEEGYTDLNNLTANGEGYILGEYTNNGWVYADNADLRYCMESGIEVRDRNGKVLNNEEIEELIRRSNPLEAAKLDRIENNKGRSIDAGVLIEEVREWRISFTKNRTQSEIIDECKKAFVKMIDEQPTKE